MPHSRQNAATSRGDSTIGPIYILPRASCYTHDDWRRPRAVAMIVASRPAHTAWCAAGRQFWARRRAAAHVSGHAFQRSRANGHQYWPHAPAGHFCSVMMPAHDAIPSLYMPFFTTRQADKPQARQSPSPHDRIIKILRLADTHTPPCTPSRTTASHASRHFSRCARNASRRGAARQ